MAYETYLALEAERNRLRLQAQQLTQLIRAEEERIRNKARRINEYFARETGYISQIQDYNQRVAAMIRMQENMRQMYDELYREQILVNTYRRQLEALQERLRYLDAEIQRYRELLLRGRRSVI